MKSWYNQYMWYFRSTEETSQIDVLSITLNNETFQKQCASKFDQIDSNILKP